MFLHTVCVVLCCVCPSLLRPHTLPCFSLFIFPVSLFLSFSSFSAYSDSSPSFSFTSVPFFLLYLLHLFYPPTFFLFLLHFCFPLCLFVSLSLCPDFPAVLFLVSICRCRGWGGSRSSPPLPKFSREVQVPRPLHLSVCAWGWPLPLWRGILWAPFIQPRVDALGLSPPRAGRRV